MAITNQHSIKSNINSEVKHLTFSQMYSQDIHQNQMQQLFQNHGDPLPSHIQEQKMQMILYLAKNSRLLVSVEG